MSQLVAHDKSVKAVYGCDAFEDFLFGLAIIILVGVLVMILGWTIDAAWWRKHHRSSDE